MYPPPNNFDFNQSPDGLKNNQTNKFSPEEIEELSSQNISQRKQELERLFIWLIGFGLTFGVILAIGIIIFLNKFGLSKKPHQIEPKQEVIEEKPLKNLEGVQLN